MFNLVVLLRKFATIWFKTCFSLSSVTFSMQAFIKAMPRSAESLVTGKWSANSFIFLYSSNFAQCWEGINSHSGFPLTSNKSKINQDPSATNVFKLGLWPGQDIVGKSLLPFRSVINGSCNPLLFLKKIWIKFFKNIKKLSRLYQILKILFPSLISILIYY